MNKTALIFKALNDISHCLAHAEKICKSWLIIPCKSAIDNAEHNRGLSSPNKRVKLSSDSTISLTYISETAEVQGLSLEALQHAPVLMLKKRI